MRALYVGNVWGRRNAMWTSSIARPRGLLMLRGSRGCAPHLLLIWIKNRSEWYTGMQESFWISQTCDSSSILVI